MRQPLPHLRGMPPLALLIVGGDREGAAVDAVGRRRGERDRAADRESRRPVVEPVAPRFTVAGALGVKASVPGPVRLKPGELTVTVALLVPTKLVLGRLRRARAGQRTPLLPQVSAPAW